eukprot:TRINITY_DN2629_c0_g1_i2.p1 TRINITY_DN2629_c0_g1~~TRINITY_DN2629_c0_g1_i2.p1  ORF type:complete len:583 (+),score=135.96 TRINITY_DN2629_c0_g1_i2:283-2031(+)
MINSIPSAAASTDNSSSTPKYTEFFYPLPSIILQQQHFMQIPSSGTIDNGDQPSYLEPIPIRTGPIAEIEVDTVIQPLMLQHKYQQMPIDSPPVNTADPEDLVYIARLNSQKVIQSSPQELIKSIELGRKAALAEKRRQWQIALDCYQKAIGGLSCVKVENNPTIKLIISRKCVDFKKNVERMQKAIHEDQLQIQSTPRNASASASNSSSPSPASDKGKWDHIIESDIVMLEDLEREATEGSNDQSELAFDMADSASSDSIQIEFPPKEGHSHDSYNRLFHRLFPDVPKKESLIWFFSCGFGNGLVAAKSGRMFVSKNHLCFCSLKNQALYTVALPTVISLEKPYPFTVLLRTNRGDEYYLRRMTRRNQYFDIIDKLWASSRVLFGIPLASIVIREGRSSKIPAIVENVITILRSEKCLKTEGLFRVSPPATEIEHLQARLQLGEHVDFNQVSNPHVTAGILKLFLRCLPEPLLTYCLYEQFLAVFDVAGTAGKQAHLRTLMKLLPESNYNLVRYLSEFLAEFIQHAPDNKMSLNNISITFSPLYLQSSDSDFDVVFLENLVVQDLVGIIVSNASQIFSERK